MQECTNARMHAVLVGHACAFVHSCILAFGCAAPAGAAVADYLGKPITSVRLVLDGRDTTEPALVQLVETRAGDPLSMLEVRESVAHLFSLGRFDDVRVDASAEGAGVALRYELTPDSPRLENRVRRQLHRRPASTSGELRRAARRSVRDVAAARPGRPAVARDWRHAARARVSPSGDQPAGRRRSAVRSAPRSCSASIPDRARPSGRSPIAGTPMMPQQEFLDRLDLAAGVPFEPEALDARITSYVDTRRARGYYQARVDAGRQLRGQRPRGQPDADGRAGPSRQRGVHRRSAARRDARRRWCRSSARGRRTRTCWRTRATGSKSSCARRGIVTPRRLTRARKRTASCSSRSRCSKGSQYRVGRRGDLRRRVAGAARSSIEPADPRRRALLGRESRCRRHRASKALYRGRGFASARVQADPRPRAGDG